MGLDMYLSKKVVKYEEKVYWRKSNAIHNWFSKHSPNGKLEDCEEMAVTKEMLEELLDTCNKVMKNHKLAPKLLPVADGFFFGSQEYGEDYFYDLEHTVKEIQRVLEETDFEEDGDLLYYAWW